MIAFSSGNVIDADGCTDNYIDPDGCNFILSVKYGGGCCISKVLMTSAGIPRQLTVIMYLNNNADIVAIPELFTSAYIPRRNACAGRLKDTARALTRAGLDEYAVCCVAIAVNIIYVVIGRDLIDSSDAAKDCLFTSSGAMELSDECKNRVLDSKYVLSDYPLGRNIKRPIDESNLPF